MTKENEALTPRHEAPACSTCGGKGYTEHEGGDGEGYPSRPEIDDCPRCHEAPAEPVSDRYRFDDEIAWLREAARYFSVRDTKGEDRAHWANAYNAENARKLADRLAELSSNPCQLEAPAEGAGEDFYAVGEFVGRQPVLCVHGSTDPNNLCPYCEGEKIWGGRNYRARSSAPEAREEALGNLLAVIHGDGGHRALEVGTKQAALEAEKIVAGLFAAPSADKLRIAVEALEPFANLGVTSGPNDEPCHYAYRITRGAIRNARQALAALKAEAK